MGLLKSVYGIVHDASQFSVNLCPQLLLMHKREFKRKGMFGIEEGDSMEHAVFSCETAKNGERWELGRGRTK